jgi:hypothetical protein
MEDIRHFYKFRPDEIFRRVTVTSLVTLMLEQSKLEYQEEDSEKLATQIREDELTNLDKVRLGSVAGTVIQATGRSKFEDGLGSGDFYVRLLISHECPHWVA